MPTYEYACKSCSHEWEVEQSIKDAPLKFCPQCNQESARRQISRGTGFILRGGGWYSDLYSSASNKPPDKSETSSEAKEAKPKADEPKANTVKSDSNGKAASSTA